LSGAMNDVTGEMASTSAKVREGGRERGREGGKEGEREGGSRKEDAAAGRS